MSDEVYLYRKKDKKGRETGPWYARKRRDGKAHCKCLDTESESLARSRAAKWLKELVDSNWGEKPRRRFDEAAEKFAEHLATLSEGGAGRYVTSIGNLAPHFRDKFLDEIDTDNLYAFEQARRKDGVTTSTIRRDLACLSSICTSAEEWKWLAINPVKPYLRARKKRGLVEGEPRTRFLTEDEEEVVLDPRWCSDIWRFRIAFAIDTCLRKTEQYGSRFREVNLNVPSSFGAIRSRGEIKVSGDLAKGDKGRVVPLLDRVYDMLKFAERRNILIFPTKYGNQYSENSPTLWEGFRKITRKAGVEDVTIHDLRRTGGCRLLQLYRLHMAEVSLWLGHSSVKVTERHYAFLSIDTLHRAVELGRENVVNFSTRVTGRVTNG